MGVGRSQSLQALAAEPFDVLVVGGGIVGAGIARDAASRGLRTALVEQHDFASGTSSRSSRLLHGGIRYLAQGRVGLVHEASVEKKVIHRIAPHLAAPLPFVFPTYRDNRNWKLWQLKIGVKIYDLLCGGRNLGKSSWLSFQQTKQQIPGLSDQQLKGAVRYFDGLTNDARLVIDTLRSARKHGAVVVNYCRFVDAKRRGNDWECELADAVTGQAIKCHARAVVNASGPWADGLPHSHVKLRLTKGIHLVVDDSRLKVPDAVVMTEGSRVLFAIPWGRRTILGTTDTDYHGSLEKIIADEDDIAYVLRITNQHFPNAKLTATDVISTWAGVRPLIASSGAQTGKPSDISRSHQIRNPEPHWWDVAGGKLTTYRLMAEQTVDQLSRSLKREGLLIKQLRPCATAEEPLLDQAELNEFSGLVPPEVTQAAVDHACEYEWAVHLEDVMIRRTSWHYYSAESQSSYEQVARWMQAKLGWSDEQREEELGPS